MTSLLHRASRNFLWRHPWQLTLAVMGIALGVAVVIAIDLALASSLNAFEQAGQAFSGTATHRIIAGDGGFDEKLYQQLRVDQGIPNLSPVISGHVHLTKQTDAGFKLIGIDPFIEKSFRSIWQTQAHENTSAGWLTRLLAEPASALIGEQTAARLGVGVNEELTIKTGHGERRLKIIGLLAADNAVSKQLLSRLILTDIATAQEFLESFGRITAIEVLADQYQTEAAPVPDRSVAYAARLAKINKALPGSVQLVPVESQALAMTEMTRAFAINLKALGLLSLLVGMFLIYNTITFLVMQRRRLIGCLRSIGVTRRQIFAAVTGEALLLASVGVLLGIVLGIALGQGLLQLISGTITAIYFPIDAASLLITPAQISKGVVLGFGATVLAVLPPAFEAARIAPATVLIRSQLEADIGKLIKILNWFGGACIIGGTQLAFWSGQSITLGLAGIFLLLFGFALVTPALTLLTMNLSEQLFGRLTGVLLRLPPRMVRAEISRTGVAIAALMIAVAAAIGMDLMIDSFRGTVADWLRTSLRADLYVALPGPKTPDEALRNRRLKASLAEMDAIQMLSSVLHTQVIADNIFTKISVFELNEKSRQGFIFKHKTDDDLWDKFEQQQTLMVTEPYAYHHGIKIGQKILLRTDSGAVPFQVAGIYADYSGDQGHLAMSRRNYRRYWMDSGYSGIGVYAKDGVNLQQLEDRLNRLISERQSVKSDQAIYHASMQVFEQTFTVTETLRWLSAAIAFAGVFSSLMALQFERTRQLGILRAIGVTPGQLAGLIIGETALMGLAAGLIAIPAGYIVAYLLIFVIYLRSFGWTMAFNFNAGAIYQGLALALLAAALAGILPALKMARTRPAEAVRQE